MTYSEGCLRTCVNGTYHTSQPLANVTIAGVSSAPKGVSMLTGGKHCDPATINMSYANATVRITGLERYFGNGAWETNVELCLHLD